MIGDNQSISNPKEDQASVKPIHTDISQYNDWPDRRSRKDRRSGLDRRKRSIPINFPDRRKQGDRRKHPRRKSTLKIPIFIKLMALSTLFIFLVILTVSLFMQARQKRQFTQQLINLGEVIAQVLAVNSRD